jgi:hypothetical protein
VDQRYRGEIQAEAGVGEIAVTVSCCWTLLRELYGLSTLTRFTLINPKTAIIPTPECRRAARATWRAAYFRPDEAMFRK